MDIVLDGNKKRFQSGEDVTGVIRFSLKGSSIVENIKICLICVEEVEWLEYPNTPYIGGYEHFTYGGHVYHEKNRLVIFGYPLPKKCKSIRHYRSFNWFDSYVSDEVLSEGEYEVPFSFKLPEKYVLLNRFLRFDSIFICF